MIPARLRPVLSRFRGPLILMGMVIAANFNIVFLGQSLVATANANPVIQEPGNLSPGLFHGGSPSVNWHDVGGDWWQWEPAGKAFARALRRGRVPLWDSSVGGGVDAHVNMIQTQYYLPYLGLLMAGDTPLLRDAYYLTELFVSGLFCFLLLRRHGCSEVSGICMGAVYMLSGSLTQTVNSSIGQSFAMVPLMIWAMDRVLGRPTWRQAGLNAFVLAFAASSSFLPAVISGYLLAAIYVAVSLVEPELRWHRLRSSIAALGLSILMLSFLLIPVELAAREDSTFQTWYGGIGQQHYSLDQMLSLLSPSVGFSVNQMPGNAAQLFSAPPAPSPFYVGLIPILIASLAAGQLRAGRRRLWWFFTATTALLFLKLIGALPAQWLGVLPIFRELHFIPYFCAALTFGIAGLCGLGIEAFLAGPSRRSRITGCLAMLTIAVLIVRFDETESLNAALQGAALASAIAHYVLEIARLTLLAACFAAILLTPGRFLELSAAGWLLAALVLLDLVPLSQHERFLRADVWASTPAFVNFLQADHSKFRVQGTQNQTLPANVSQAFGIDVLSSRMVFNSSRYANILSRYFDAPELPYPLAARLIPSSRGLLDVLNVKYVLLHVPDAGQLREAADAGLQPVLQRGPYTIFRNPKAWERAYFATSVKVESDPQKELASLATLQPGSAVLEEWPPAVPVANGSVTNGSVTNGAVANGSVQSLHYDYDRIAVRVQASSAGLLVLTENFAPGWRATVTGHAAKIYRANYSFQAVAVPAGSSEILFQFTPPGLYTGIAVSLIAAALSALLCLFRASKSYDDAA